MKRARFVVLRSIAGLVVVVLACNSAPTESDAGSDTSAGYDSSEDVTALDSGGVDTAVPDSGGADSASDSTAAESGGEETGATPVNGCATFTDLTVGGAVITGPSSSAPAQFSPNCVKIKAGHSVTWNVGFANHPLAASGGATPNPVLPTTYGTTVTFAFPTPGVYGFHCVRHPTIMLGAVEVIP
jgi:plastocyanin